MKKFLKKYIVDVICLVLILLTFPIFFHRLGQSSLVSFDEAWYGDIARNILISGNLINLSWNGGRYIDHPPAGFWLIAFSEKIFGVDAFGVRFVPAFCGLLSMIVLYLLGKELFSRGVGFASALALPSAFWFLFRARSGNLDVILTFAFLLCIYLAIKASKEKIFLLPWSISLAFLLLTKTLVPLIIIPALMVIFWKTKHSWKDFRWPGTIVCGMVGGWFTFQIIQHPFFLSHYFGIGLPGVHIETNYLENFKLIKEYLHSGVGKWFWPGIAAVSAVFFLRQKRFLILSLFFFTFFIPFIFSAKGHIWHLIPLYPIMILSFFGVSYVILKRFVKNECLILLFFLIIAGYVSFLQTRRSWYEFIDVPAFVSDEEVLSTEAGKYQYDFYIDGDFLPAAIFYSGKNVKQIMVDELPDLFKQEKPVLLITYQWRLDGEQISKDNYQVIKTDRDKMLIFIK